MYEWTIESNGNKLKLTGSEKKWQLVSVKGINPVGVTLNTSKQVNVPGVRITGSQTPERVLTFMLRINHPCERNRQELLDFLVPDSEVKAICRTPLKTVNTTGKISINDYDPYTQSQVMQFEILCEHSYFIASETRKDGNLQSQGGFKFPLNIGLNETFKFEEYSFTDKVIVYNYGQIATGIEVEIKFLDTVEKPKVYDVDNPNEYIELNDTFLPGDIIKINTNLKHKKVTLVRNGVETKIMRKLVFPVKWFTISKVLVLAINYENKMLLDVYTHDEVAGI